MYAIPRDGHTFKGSKHFTKVTTLHTKPGVESTKCIYPMLTQYGSISDVPGLAIMGNPSIRCLFLHSVKFEVHILMQRMCLHSLRNIKTM